MYAEFFGLKQDPFSIAPDPRYLFMSERHREALAHLLYGVQGGGGFVLLTGEIGTGKTTVCRCFLEQTPAQCQVAYIFNPKLTVIELLRSICDEFGVEVPHTGAGEATVKDHLDPLNAFLLASHATGRNAVLIIDEAQNLSADVLEQLRLLTNLETSERKLLQIVLIGQPELRGLLARPELEQLAQRVIARYHLDALNEAETRQYIQHRMEVAGLHGPLPVAANALHRIHTLARGVPRRINLLCGRALLGAYAGGRHTVDKAVVDKAAREVFDDGHTATTPARPRRPLGQLAWLGAGAAAGVLLTLALLQRPGTTAQAANEAAPPLAAASGALPAGTETNGSPSTAADAPAAVETAAQTTPATPMAPPLSTLPTASDLLRPQTLAWRALGPMWSPRLGDGEPCAAAPAQQLQCYRTSRMTLHGLRQLNRPGLLTLRLPGQPPGWALITGITAETATLQAGQQRWQIPLTALADIWRGEFATLWRLPPGQTTRLTDGTHGSAGRWLDQQLSSLQAAGQLPPGAQDLDARVQAFQRAHGIDADGGAGPVTYMQLNRASGVDEPRLNPA